MEYFESILENIAAFDKMDVYGHIDYVVRYGPNQNRQYSYGRYKEILDEILRTLIRKNIGIELNTGGYHYGLGEPNPCVNVIRRYRELGGENHYHRCRRPHPRIKIAYAFDRAADVLRDCGLFLLYCVQKPSAGFSQTVDLFLSPVREFTFLYRKYQLFKEELYMSTKRLQKKKAAMQAKKNNS